MLFDKFSFRIAAKLDLSHPWFGFILLHDFRLRLAPMMQANGSSIPSRQQNTGVDEGMGHAAEQFNAYPGSDPHAPTSGVCQEAIYHALNQRSEAVPP
jgi:hypothetical protein